MIGSITIYYKTIGKKWQEWCEIPNNYKDPSSKLSYESFLKIDEFDVSCKINSKYIIESDELKKIDDKSNFELLIWDYKTVSGKSNLNPLNDPWIKTSYGKYQLDFEIFAIKMFKSPNNYTDSAGNKYTLDKGHVILRDRMCEQLN